MENDTEAVLEQLKTLVTASQEQGLLLHEELGKLLPKVEPEDDNVDANTELTTALTKLKLSQVTKLRKYSKGENFSRFCQRFIEYVYITRMKDEHLYLFLLQHVCDETYSILKSVELTDEEKRNENLFCAKYKEAIYGEQSIPLKSEVMDCKQQSDEDVSDFAYRLREKANIAFSDQELRDETCFLAFTRGVKDTQIRRKLDEGNVTDFNEALKLAKKLEKVENMINNKHEEVSSILKETSVSFKTSRSRESSPA